jgi:hypothetical protein
VNSRLLLSQTATLSATEVALGSLVHGFKIPLGGHLLSLNQGLILTWCVRRLRARVASVQAINSISLTSGALKALSPMGNRLGPMLAISMQGLLYSCGVLLLGANFAGALAGMFLLALWGVLQPVLVAWLLFGRSVFDGLLKLWGDIASLLGMSEEILWPVLAGFVGLKVLAGWLQSSEAINPYLWDSHVSSCLIAVSISITPYFKYTLSKLIIGLKYSPVPLLLTLAIKSSFKNLEIKE